MKLLVLSFVYSFNIFAASHIGEFAKFNFVQADVPGTYQVKVKALQNDQYVIENSTQVGDQRSVSTSFTKKSDLITRAKIAQILEYCGQIGGVNEQIDIGDKTFSTCKLTADNAYSVGLIQGPIESDFDAFVWAGDVPVMGIVKMTNGEFVMTIKNYKWNSK